MRGTEAFLRAVLEPVWGSGVRFEALEPLTSGASRRSWRFESGGSLYVLQAEMGPRESSDADGEPLSMVGQAELMRMAAAAGVPVAAVVGAGTHDGVQYLVCEWLPGEALPPVLLRDPRLGVVLRSLQGDCARALAAVHALPVEETMAATGLRRQDRLGSYRARLDEIDEPRPVLELGWRWLEEHRPSPTPAVVLHGDFRLGNLLVGPEGLAAVLDWELAHVGDRHEDLAWPTLRAWRFDRHRPPGVFPDVEVWPEDYERVAGTGTVDWGALRWWQVAGTWSWAVICAMQARRHLDGWVRSPEHALIGRRVCESEWDLLELIDGQEAR